MAKLLLDNIYKIEIPLPRNPLKSLNSYFIKNSDGRSLLIDTGFNRKECKEAIFAALKELQVDLDNTDLFITHLHSDHCGLISVLPKPGAKIYAGKIDGDIINIFTAHREKIEDPYKRIDELLKHHEIRLAEVMNIIQGKTLNAYKVAEHMTWDIKCETWEDFPAQQKWFAVGEAIAHLQYLFGIGELEKKKINGIYCYKG
ncbi:MAG: MBL fold metallo-hydrolase [Eubacteriales bacterium]|nr:MBL fold metallo-hydrolase [Eubacteriales bacterium]MDD3200268.1 MBL fold metallo-hydrolase [Eubacteriales bacterium]MDD4122553.1 MBL fold metallo-hydrolase [Eubacteriales bacterium]MDD4629346.1 MBL fold metallo-hydrolase [Eubacteriales bacterium]